MVENNYEIEGFKEHRESYEIIGALRKELINAETNKDYKKLIDVFRSLITESAPYNGKWKKDLEDFEKEIDKIYDDKHYTSDGKLKTSSDAKKEFAEAKTKFFQYSRELKASLLIAFSKAKLIPSTTSVEVITDPKERRRKLW